MGLDYKEQIGCLGGYFLQLTGCIRMLLIVTCRVKNLDQTNVFTLYVGTEEADDTDKTLMAGNIKQAYIDSSLSYYHDLIARGLIWKISRFTFNLVRNTMKKLGPRIYQTVFAFSLKNGTSLY